MFSHGIFLKKKKNKKTDLFSLSWNSSFSRGQLRPGPQHYVCRMCPQAHPTHWSTPHTDSAFCWSIKPLDCNTARSGILYWKTYKKGWTCSRSTGKIHQVQKISGCAVWVWHTCSWGVRHYVSPSLGTKDPFWEGFPYGVGVVSMVNIVLSKDFPTKIMITIYCHGRERQQWENLSWFHYMQWSNWH